MRQIRIGSRTHSSRFHSSRSRLFRRTASGGKYFRTAVLFCLGLLIFHGFSGKVQEADAERARSRYTVVRESMAGREEVPLEEYLIGALAGSVPEDFAPQACRAQAVILRTNAVYIAKREGLEKIPCEILGQESLTAGEMQEKWGDDCEAQYRKLEEAVKDTKDQLLVYEGNAVELPFFPLSAGKTRKACELWPDETFPYLGSVSCEADMFAEVYEQEKRMSGRELTEVLGRLFGAAEEISAEEIQLLRDSAGYVTALVWKEEQVPGEVFRKETGLASSCFTIEQDKNDIYIITKGIGHGLGMSQYTADVMAEEGKDYREILAYFFPACEITK